MWCGTQHHHKVNMTNMNMKFQHGFTAAHAKHKQNTVL